MYETKKEWESGRRGEGENIVYNFIISPSPSLPVSLSLQENRRTNYL